jgi:hypothetical protein
MAAFVAIRSFGSMPAKYSFVAIARAPSNGRSLQKQSPARGLSGRLRVARSGSRLARRCWVVCLPCYTGVRLAWALWASGPFRWSCPV